MSSRVRELAELSDEELAEQFQQGESAAVEVLIGRYRRFARSKTRAYFLTGGDANDVEQEGLIGLFKAARDFAGDRQVSFRVFAELCVTRQIVTAVKAANRHKHQALNRYVSASPRSTDDEGGEHAERLFGSDRAADPCDQVVSRQRLEQTRRHMAEMLTTLEADVLRLHVDGYSYKEISDRVGRHVKSVDNCLQRVKRKVNNGLAGEDDRGPLAAV